MRFSKALIHWIVLVCSPAILFGSNLQMSTPPGEVQVAGATPGGSVILMGVARQSIGWMSKADTVTFQVQDLELDGAVTFSLTNNPMNFNLDDSTVHRALWIAVDLATGDSIVYSTDGGEVIESPADIHPSRSDGQWRVGFDTPRFEAMVVRPGTGAWAGSFADGGPEDLSNGSDGSVTLASTSLVSVPNGSFTNLSTLSRFNRGDIFFFIDYDTLQYKILSTGKR